ncbi:MAG: winged helix-turn-helix transcriptional regulator [Methanobacteriota archaeon]
MTRVTSELETQKRIFLLISQEPGLHITRIAQLLSISEPLTLYHIRYLEKRKLISVNKDVGYTRCYPKGAVGVEDKKRFSVLRQYLPLQIVMFLLKNPCARHKEILEHFTIAKSTLSYHLKKLLKLGIIVITTGEGDPGYLVINEKDVITFLMKYQPLRAAAGMQETWEDFSIYHKK